MIKPITLKVEQENISGIIHVPEKNRNEQHNCIFLNGPGTFRCGPHRISYELSESLTKLGICSFRYDYLGRGESGQSKNKFSYDSMVHDSFDVIKKMRAQCPDLKFNIMIANCMGCIPGLALMEKSNSIDYGIFLSAGKAEKDNTSFRFINHFRYLLRIYLKKLNKDTLTRILKRDIDFESILKAFFGFSRYRGKVVKSPEQNKQNNSQPETKSNTTKKILFIYGRNDPYIDLIDYYKEFSLKRGWESEFIIIKDANRTFDSYEATNEVINKLNKWFKKHIS